MKHQTSLHSRFTFHLPRVLPSTCPNFSEPFQTVEPACQQAPILCQRAMAPANCLDDAFNACDMFSYRS